MITALLFGILAISMFSVVVIVGLLAVIRADMAYQKQALNWIVQTLSQNSNS